MKIVTDLGYIWDLGRGKSVSIKASTLTITITKAHGDHGNSLGRRPGCNNESFKRAFFSSILDIKAERNAKFSPF
jgi:hypothetical protein